MSGAAIIIDFFPAQSNQKRLQPIVARLNVTDADRQAAFKLGPFTKQFGGAEYIAIACHDVRVATALVKSLRASADELEAAVAKAANPFAK